MEDGDEWLALDKLQHFLFSFFLTIIFTLLATRAPYSFIRNRSVWFGSVVSLIVGAAKEVADEMGYFRSAGASSKDAVSDLFGTSVAAVALSLGKYYSFRVSGGTNNFDAIKATEMV